MQLRAGLDERHSDGALLLHPQLNKVNIGFFKDKYPPIIRQITINTL
jgi:hypothetical protein